MTTRVCVSRSRRFSFSILVVLLLLFQDSFAFRFVPIAPFRPSTSTSNIHTAGIQWTRPCPRRTASFSGFLSTRRRGYHDTSTSSRPLLLAPIPCNDPFIRTDNDDDNGNDEAVNPKKSDETNEDIILVVKDKTYSHLVAEVSRRRMFGILVGATIVASTTIIPTIHSSSHPPNLGLVKPSYAMDMITSTTMAQNKSLTDILMPSQSSSSSPTPTSSSFSNPSTSTRRTILVQPQPQNNTISIVYQDEKGAQVYINRTSLEKIKQDPLYPSPWVPSIFQPKPKEFGTVADSQVFVAGIVAGSLLELIRSAYLYPLSTIKTRIQNNRGGRRVSMSSEPSSSAGREDNLPSLAQRLDSFSTSFQKQIEIGNFYAGIQATLFASVPAAGVYFGVRDVMKRELTKVTHLDDLSVTLLGALVADVVSIAVRTPALTYSTRRQAQSAFAHDESKNCTTSTWDASIVITWIQQVTMESWEQLPAIIITDLPYLLLRIACTRILIQSQPFEDIGTYELYNIVSACICAALTTPFDVARTRILVDSDGDPSNGLDGGSGIGVWETLMNVMGEYEIPRSISESIKDTDPPPIHYFMEEVSVQRTGTGDQSKLMNDDDDDYRITISANEDKSESLQWQNLYAGWFERTLYFGVAVAWLDPIRVLGYLGIRDALLLEWFK